MRSLTQEEKFYWEGYVNSLPVEERPINPSVTAGFAGNASTTDSLLELYLSGKKTAGSSLVEDFLAAGDPLPQPGTFWIFLNSHGKPSCILRTEKVVTHKFRNVPPEIALAEGEGDLSLEYWRKVHSDLYSPFLSAWGIKDMDDATVITEIFSVVYK